MRYLFVFAQFQQSRCVVLLELLWKAMDADFVLSCHPALPETFQRASAPNETTSPREMNRPMRQAISIHEFEGFP